MTSKELWKKRIEYAVKNNDSTLESLAEKLELLESIKNYFWLENGTGRFKGIKIIHCDIGSESDKEMFKKIKEWLENEKND